MNRNAYANLSTKQKEFIKEKVKELGSAKAAKLFYLPAYGTKDLVTRYALKMIREIYNE